VSGNIFLKYLQKKLPKPLVFFFQRYYISFYPLKGGLNYQISVFLSVFYRRFFTLCGDSKFFTKKTMKPLDKVRLDVVMSANPPQATRRVNEAFGRVLDGDIWQITGAFYADGSGKGRSSRLRV
jgi:hypothetical protein